MSGIINKGNISLALKDLITRWFGNEYDQNPAMYKEIFDVMKSDHDYEEDALIYGTGLASEISEGDDAPFDDLGIAGTKQYVHKKFGLALKITEEAKMDGKYIKLAEEMARSHAITMKETMDEDCFAVLNNAFVSTGGYEMFDSKALCANDHSHAKGGTYDNLLDASALSELAIENALIAIRNAKGHENMFIKLRGQELLVPPALEFTAKRILMSDKQNDTALNAVNAIRGSLDIKVIPYLSDTNAYFIKTNARKGLTVYERLAPMVSDDVQILSGNEIHRIIARWSRGATDPKCIYGSAGPS